MPLQDLLVSWKSQDLGLLAPETPEQVEETFSQMGYPAAEDAVRLYSMIGGMQEPDDNFFRLWSLREITEENREPSVFGLLFADYLINAWCYRLRPDSATQSSVYVDHFDGTPAKLVAADLDEFFDLYTRDPKKVYAF